MVQRIETTKKMVFGRANDECATAHQSGKPPGSVRVSKMNIFSNASRIAVKNPVNAMKSPTFRHNEFSSNFLEIINAQVNMSNP